MDSSVVRIQEETAAALQEHMLTFTAPRRGLRFGLLRSLVRSKGGFFGIIVLAAMVFSALFAPWVALHKDPNSQLMPERLQPPVWEAKGSWDHILGTDHLGRDVWSRIVYGSRVSLVVGLAAVTFSAFVGIGLGLLAGFIGKIVDNIVTAIMDTQLAMPRLLLAIVVAALLRPSLLNVVLVLGISSWVQYARVIRGETLSIRERDFVDAARVTGCSNGRILVHHVLPNTLSSMTVIATLQFAAVVLLEASLSFLGLGVPANIPSWGTMLADGRAYLGTAWWLAVLPGMAIMMTVLGVNLLGDWLRDYMDPRLQVRRR
jgi:peptide/nickel transport system permease protein